MSARPKGIIHGLQVDIADAVGPSAALLYNYIAWCADNNRSMNSDRHLKDDRWWTHKTLDELSEALSYLSYNQVRTALGKLIKSGLIVDGEYNTHAYDRTKWYSPNYAEWFEKTQAEALSEQLGISVDEARQTICEISQMEM